MMVFAAWLPGAFATVNGLPGFTQAEGSGLRRSMGSWGDGFLFLFFIL